ncbi:MAG TPA: PQQ-dependent sugar dehydrogenase [Thermoanaerobaculia bacterium]|jgi:glucose/arabinose dehydrogenase|nr:PQQ-dependent sugar dehydrogenase [Thermoanaerobaculia bacterium]
MTTDLDRTSSRHRSPASILRLAAGFFLGAMLAGFAGLAPSPLAAFTLPDGFTQEVAASGLANPTAMALAPDGRIFITQQGGDLRVWDHGLVAAPFLQLDVDNDGERGLLGVALDPQFATNGFVYVYYTVPSEPRHNRVSRFTANGNAAVPGSETILLDLDNLTGATNHNGGALHFGPDDKLYIAAGENATSSNSQTLGNLLGKILRINKDGSIPNDNPFFGQAQGKNRAIWVLGLRNPYTFTFGRTNGRMLINDVGQNTWEEIDDGARGANYGWPNTEGPTNNPLYVSPRFSYQHGDGGTRGCAITGGAFYDPPTERFPADYRGDYFFADFCNGWIRRLDLGSGAAIPFASDVEGAVDLRTGPDGSLWVLSYFGGTLVRVGHEDEEPPLPRKVRGLAGNYFDGPAFSGAAIERLDGPIDFDFGGGAPLPGIHPESYSVRWIGQIEVPVSGTYRFVTESDDGVRLWVNGVRMVDNWGSHGVEEDSGTLALAAGRRYAIRLDYRQDAGQAVIRLSWEPPGAGRSRVPADVLFPPALLVTGSSVLGAGDAAVKARLESLGFAVTTRAAAASVERDARGKALVAISSTVSGPDVNTKFRASLAPVLTWESELFDDLGLTGARSGRDFGRIGGQRAAFVFDPASPLAAGLSGNVTIAAVPSSFAWGRPRTAAHIVLQSTGTARRPLVFTYERGDGLVGLTAPARRVGFFLGDATAASWSADGAALFDAAAIWATGQ